MVHTINGAAASNGERAAWHAGQEMATGHGAPAPERPGYRHYGWKADIRSACSIVFCDKAQTPTAEG